MRDRLFDFICMVVVLALAAVGGYMTAKSWSEEPYEKAPEGTSLVLYNEAPEKESLNPVEANAPEVPQIVALGEFRLTSYCGGKCCNGRWAGQTSTGVEPVEGRTIAVDPDVIPYGSTVWINGNEYTAEDCGGAIKGKKIDVFLSSHEAALRFGVQYAPVFLEVGTKG